MVPLFMDAMDHYFRDPIYQLSQPDENRFDSIDIKLNPGIWHFNITLIPTTFYALPDIDNVVEYQVDQNVASTGIIGLKVIYDPESTVDRGGVGA